MFIYFIDTLHGHIFLLTPFVLYLHFLYISENIKLENGKSGKGGGVAESKLRSCPRASKG